MFWYWLLYHVIRMTNLSVSLLIQVYHLCHNNQFSQQNIPCYYLTCLLLVYKHYTLKSCIEWLFLCYLATP